MKYELARTKMPTNSKRWNSFRFSPCWRSRHDDCPGMLDLPSRHGWEQCFCSCICHMNDRSKYDGNGQPYSNGQQLVSQAPISTHELVSEPAKKDSNVKC